MVAASETEQGGTRDLAWLALPAFAAAIAVLWLLEPPAAHESPFLLTALNLIFSTCVALFVAYLCARSFVATAELGVLLLGCGVLIWGAATGIAASGISRSGNISVTVHNLGAWFAAACSLAGAVLASRARVVRTPSPWVAGVYSAGLATVVLVTVATFEQWTPTFFVQGQGGTPVRQAVLGCAVGLFAATAGMLWRLNRRIPSAFLRWYASGLGLLATGLAGVWLQTFHGSLLGWAARAAQYVGGGYLLMAGVSAVRHARGWRISLAEALRASQARYAAFAAATFEGIVETESGRIVACNEQFAHMVGRPAADLEGLKVLDLVSLDDRERVAAGLALNVESVIQHGVLRPDGKRVEVEAHGRPVAEDSGRRYTAVRDVTDQKRSQERAARLTTLYAVLSRVNEAIVRIHDERHLFGEICRIVAEEGRFELVWIGEVDGRCVVPRASAGPETAYLEEVRIEIDGPLGQGPTGRAFREGRPAFNDDFSTSSAMTPWREAALRHGLRASASFPLRRDDKPAGVLTLYSSALDSFDREAVTLLEALAADLSYALDAMSQERRRAEAVDQLRKSEEARKVADAVRAERQRLFDVLETLPAMISLLTPDYRVEFANRGFRDRFGESLGRRCFEYCYGRTAPCEFCESHRVLEIGRSHRWESTACDGTILDVFASPFTDVDGSPMILEMILDVSESRRAEAAVRDAHTRLEERAEQLRALARELTVSAQRERRRLAGLLHDHMQQLLIAAKYRAAALGQSRDTATRETAAEVERLLDMSIAEGRALTAELSPPTLRAGDLREDLAWLSHRMADRYGFTVDLSIEGDLPALSEDARAVVFEAVRELLFNAVKHADVPRAALVVRKASATEISIVVSDAGKGFDPGRLRQVVESSGTFGLLSIRERLELLGSSMVIESAPGRGSRFTLTIQAGPAGDAKDSLKDGSPSARLTDALVPGGDERGLGIRVLLADDHAVVREGLRRLLNQEDDIEVVGEATDGIDVVTLAAALKPHVILMDLSMPRLDGLEATRAIHTEQPSVRIIGLSMFEDGTQAQQMREAGATEFVTKSAPPEALVAAVRRAGLAARSDPHASP